MKRIPWWIWLAVMSGIVATIDKDVTARVGATNWLLAVGILVFAYYSEKAGK